MLSARTKRVSVCELEAATVMDLLNGLPKRLLSAVVKEYGLRTVDDSKSAMVLAIAEHRKIVFKELKFSLSYAKRE